MSLEHDNLNTLLRTTLLPDDPGYNELLDRRLAWWDSSHVRSWFLENGYTLYHRYQYEDHDFIVEMYPPGAEAQQRVFPYPYEGEMDHNPHVSEYRPFHAYTGHRVRDLRSSVKTISTTSLVPIVCCLLCSGSFRAACCHQGNTRWQWRVSHSKVPYGTRGATFCGWLPLRDTGSGPSFLWRWMACDHAQVRIHIMILQSNESSVVRWGMSPLHPFLRSIHEVFHFMHCLLKVPSYLPSLKLVLVPVSGTGVPSWT